MWHDLIQKLPASQRPQVVGIVEEQHPERARLFMQWKQMEWPLLTDSLNLLRVAGVPIVLALDEDGIIRAVDPPLKDGERWLASFVRRPPVGGRLAALEEDTRKPDLESLRAAAVSGGPTAQRAYGDALVLWGGPQSLSDAIGAYVQALNRVSDDATVRFRLGVAYRRRWDSALRQPWDFARAVEAWSRSLELDPNDYICRRRLQQYGPRLQKPYPFYDWVEQARLGIRRRGQAPVPLEVEPTGSELAEAAASFQPATRPPAEPDPSGKVLRDGGLVTAAVTVVPTVVEPGAAARIHVTLMPNAARKAHWNNEASDLALWVRPPPGWEASARIVRHPNPAPPTSQEHRSLELEVRCPAKALSGAATIPAYALYYVCEDINGVCLYRRQDIPIRVDVRAPVPPR